MPQILWVRAKLHSHHIVMMNLLEVLFFYFWGAYHGFLLRSTWNLFPSSLQTQFKNVPPPPLFNVQVYLFCSRGSVLFKTARVRLCYVRAFMMIACVIFFWQTLGHENISSIVGGFLESGVREPPCRSAASCRISQNLIIFIHKFSKPRARARMCEVSVLFFWVFLFDPGVWGQDSCPSVLGRFREPWESASL